MQALAHLAAQYILIADSSIFVEKLQGAIPVIIRTVRRPRPHVPAGIQNEAVFLKVLRST